MQRPAFPAALFPILAAMLLAGCATMATQRLAGNLSHAMLNQNDPATVRVGAPAYLLLLDSMIEGNPNDRHLLTAASRLYGAYAGGLVEEEKRKQRLSQQSLDYARKALCNSQPELCTAETEGYESYASAVADVPVKDIDLLYTYSTSKAGWIAARSGDWNALAELPKVERTLERVIEIDPAYGRGRAQLYLAVMRTQLPPALGGKPERGQAHFDLAVHYSEHRDLMVKVEYARRYARLVFNQELHDRLLKEVLSADPTEPDLTLSNVLAQEEASRLLQDDYF